MATQTKLRQLVARVPDPATKQALAAIVAALEATPGVPTQFDAPSPPPAPPPPAPTMADSEEEEAPRARARAK